MAVMFNGTRFQSFKSDGTVNAAGWVYFYEIGTSTEKTTYSDSALSVANASPVVLNSAGAADIWYSGDADVSVYDSDGVLVDAFSNINPAETSTANEANLIANGSFESGASVTDPDGWVRSDPYSGGTSEQDTDSSHGLYSWKFISAGNGGGILTSESFFNVTEGRSYLLSWMMKSSVADVRNVVEVLWYDDADAYISASTAYDNSTTNPTSWTLKSYTATPVATAVQAKIRITGCHSSDATAGTTRFDGVVVTENTHREAKGADVASATALVLGTDGDYFDVTGTTTITSIGTLGVGTTVKLHFDDALTLTHHATDLILPGAANITTVAGYEMEFTEYATGDWRCTGYTRPTVIATATGTAATYLGVATFSPTINVDVGDIVVVNYKATGVMNGTNQFLETIVIAESGAGTCVLQYYPSQACTIMFGSNALHGSGATVDNCYTLVFRVTTAGTLIAVGAAAVSELGTTPSVRASYVYAEVRKG
jgi:hypothetical protein